MEHDALFKHVPDGSELAQVPAGDVEFIDIRVPHVNVHGALSFRSNVNSSLNNNLVFATLFTLVLVAELGDLLVDLAFLSKFVLFGFVHLHVMDDPLELLPILMADQERGNPDVGAHAVIRHDQHLWVLILVVVNDYGH